MAGTKVKEFDAEVKEIVDHLSEQRIKYIRGAKKMSCYQSAGYSIKYWLNRGYTVDDCKLVNAYWAKKWSNDGKTENITISSFYKKGMSGVGFEEKLLHAQEDKYRINAAEDFINTL